MTLGTAPHPVTESRRQVFFFFFLSFILSLRLRKSRVFTSGLHLQSLWSWCWFSPSRFHGSGRCSWVRTEPAQVRLQRCNVSLCKRTAGGMKAWKGWSSQRSMAEGWTGSEIRRRSWWWRWAASSALPDWPSARKGHLVHTPEKQQRRGQYAATCTQPALYRNNAHSAFQRFGVTIVSKEQQVK